MNQRKHFLELLAKHGLTGCKPASTPIDPATKLHVADSNLLKAHLHLVCFITLLLISKYNRFMTLNGTDVRILDAPSRVFEFSLATY
jgi:hypothetical protein